MGQSTIHTDDLDPGVKAEHVGVTLTFGDTTVLLDLSEENHDELAEFLEPYLAAGTAPKASKRRADAAQVRLWAAQRDEFRDAAKGRGRLPNAVYAAYDEAQAS